ncbi:hypothetical protein CSB93_2775 [Pseudomonas paraeruginosa]|uniref:Uncharacterized protein n=1 Tax=Pseudomonas paraeruginosa TaxID=2994495 RepID=A0A2R3J4B8_9PSED|nr:hypothetical protein CSB93_2775 [Pseudomonas paraeruginosa]
MHTCRAFVWEVIAEWKFGQVDSKLLRELVQEFVGVISDQS